MIFLSLDSEMVKKRHVVSAGNNIIIAAESGLNHLQGVANPRNNFAVGRILGRL